jgi:ribonuclease HII
MTNDEKFIYLKKYEDDLKKSGYGLIAGVDEAGRGPLAGPVVACACIIKDDFYMQGINDSKKLTAKKRELIYRAVIENEKIDFGIGIVDSITIDNVNILQATFLAMKIAINNLKNKPGFIIFDGNQYPLLSIPSEGIIKGDSKCLSISLASIIAKYTRDEIMESYHKKHPEFGFNSHKGYGTKKHIEAINSIGILPIHRKSFEPIKTLVDKEKNNG